MLPTPGSVFPPEQWGPAFEQYRSNAAWYSGSQVDLYNLYATGGNAYSRGDDPATHYNRGDGTLRRGGVRGLMSRMWNGQIVAGGALEENRTRLHAPVATNIAALSADVLVSEPPQIRIVGRDGKVVQGPVGQANDDIMNSPATQRTIQEGAELTAGLSAVLLAWHWDRAVAPLPYLVVSPCDAVVPEYSGGRLTSAIAFTYHHDIVLGVTRASYVHVERHGAGVIEHALYPLTTNGVRQQVGEPVPFDRVPELAYLQEIQGVTLGEGQFEHTISIPTGIERLTATWWRNRPTRTHRQHPMLRNMGRADFEGVEQFLDQIDMTWSSWMRDVKLARARLLVPESMLEVDRAGFGGVFDDEREIMTAVTALDTGDQGGITQSQFAIRATEHAATLYALTREVTQFAGYSMASYGEQAQSGQMTATEVVDRVTMTERTRDAKGRELQAALEELVPAGMDLYAAHFGGPRFPADARVEVEFTELSQIDPEKEARTLGYIRTAMAASTLTIVRSLHPEYDERELAEEVRRIQSENGLMVDADPARVGRVDGLPDPQPEVDPVAGTA